MGSNAFEGFASAVRSAVPMASLTSFHIGGAARYLIEPRTLEELTALAGRCRDACIPIHILGGGSNILVSDRGVPGAVFRLSKMTKISRSGARIVCEAGAPLRRLLRKAEECGLGGLEPLAGIPGTLGGAIAMNAGGRHGSVASVLRSVTTLDQFCFVHERAPADLGLGYRRSELRGEVVLSAVFDLVEKNPAEITRTGQAVLEEKARTQPLRAWSAGCVFKNPDGQAAGHLIDLAGLKGERVGRAIVSPKHANFIINKGGATAHDVLALIGRVKAQVWKVFETELELEIEVWN